ncbi:cytochrome P450 4C1-like [Galendromus occidentalis]|uniref:Cytochrome P450 4C1-like n=1 Tax=Galendromus occidentalis TaxID=34638 RepID=A0AAJ7WHU7_9ACAR|nr:cytochrome P450 4C1-like [Galendromus occidentalis]
MMTSIQGFSTVYENVGLYRFYLLFRPIVVLTAPETAEQILKDSSNIEKGCFYDLLRPWLRTGLLTSSGPKWRSRRKLLTPAFHFRILEDFMVIFNEQSMLMADLLARDCGAKPIEISKRVTKCTLDIICETAMGVEIKAQENSNSSYVRAVYSLGASFSQRCIRPWQWLSSIYPLTPEGRKYQKDLATLHAFTEEVINERKKHRGEFLVTEGPRTADDCVIGIKRRRAFLDLLLARHSENGELSLLDIQEEVDTFMFEGHDTTAMGISWCLYLIGQDLDVQRKIHEELDSVFGFDRHRFATSNDLSRLKYLECCLKEAQRLFPSVPFIARELQRDIHIGQYTIPRGTTCLVNIFHIHRNKKHFPNPEMFDPDRFHPENSVARHPYAFIPFSAGSRNCIGQKFAQLEEKVILANLLRRFEIRSMLPRDKLLLVGEMVVRSHNGLMVRIRER